MILQNLDLKEPCNSETYKFWIIEKLKPINLKTLETKKFCNIVTLKTRNPESF
jgi:hypothetical protein